MWDMATGYRVNLGDNKLTIKGEDGKVYCLIVDKDGKVAAVPEDEEDKKEG